MAWLKLGFDSDSRHLVVGAGTGLVVRLGPVLAKESLAGHLTPSLRCLICKRGLDFSLAHRVVSQDET